MAFRHTTTKPVYRFTVVDHSVTTWAIQDRETGKKVLDADGEVRDFRDPLAASMIADELNEGLVASPED